ncbi:MAG TPA: transketolase, partial [Thermodesulfobacteriota bacterium]
EWDPFAGLALPRARIEAFLSRVPFRQRDRRVHAAPAVPVPARLDVPTAAEMSTQEGFGRLLYTLGREGGPLADRVVTVSPDVTASTNLGGWVNQRGIFDRQERADVFRALQLPSPLRWEASRRGQHFELGIAEHNLFLMLAALGLSGPLFGVRLLPVGTLYDPFIMRGLDALNYACYQDARFMLVATPSGVTLAPEGGAHQSIGTPLVGMAIDHLVYFEPAYVDELAAIMRWGFDYMQQEDGGSVYLRLSTRAIAQPTRTLDEAQVADVLAGGYWRRAPGPGAEIAVVYAGAVAPEAEAAVDAMLEDLPGAGLLAVTSPGRLHAGWTAACADRASRREGSPSHVERLLAALPADAALVTVIDGHPATLSWLGAVAGHPIVPLGVSRFGQSGDIPDLYRLNRLDTDAILDAAAAALLARERR